MHASASWLDRVCHASPLPRAALVRMLDRPGALEYEVAVLISDAAWSTAERLMDAREQPDAGDDLWSRAVQGCYDTLKRRVMAESRARLTQVLE